MGKEKEEVTVEEEIVESVEYTLRVANVDNGEEIFNEEDLSYCDVEIGAMEGDDGVNKSDQLYYIITAGDEPDEHNETVDFEIYAPVDKCVVIKQKNTVRE